MYWLSTSVISSSPHRGSTVGTTSNTSASYQWMLVTPWEVVGRWASRPCPRVSFAVEGARAQMAQMLGIFDRRQDDARPARIGLERFDYRAERALDDVVGLRGPTPVRRPRRVRPGPVPWRPRWFIVDPEPWVAVRSGCYEGTATRAARKPCADSPIRDETPPGKPGGVSKTRPSPAE
jgi:hypothetical protein